MTLQTDKYKLPVLSTQGAERKQNPSQESLETNSMWCLNGHMILPSCEREEMKHAERASPTTASEKRGQGAGKAIDILKIKN